MRRIVVVQWSRLGDVLQTRPLLSHIARRTDAQMVLCADARYGAVVSALPEPVEFWPVNLERLSALAKHKVSQPEAIRELADLCVGEHSGVEEVYVLSRSLAACVFAELLRPKQMYGYRRHGGDILVPDLLGRFEDSARRGQVVHRQLADAWLQLDGQEVIPSWPKPLNHAPHTNAEPSIGLICDAGTEQREIPVAWLAQLIEYLNPQSAINVALLGSRVPSADALSELAANNRHVTDLRGRMSLEQYMHVLAAQSMVIGPDTGGLHLAAALDIPVIGLYFGGASCSNTGPYAERAIVIQDPAWDEDSVSAVAELAMKRTISSSSVIYSPCLDQQGLHYKVQMRNVRAEANEL